MGSYMGVLAGPLGLGGAWTDANLDSCSWGADLGGGPSPPILYTSCSGRRRGLSVGRVGGRMVSSASSRDTPLALPSLRSTFQPLNHGICVGEKGLVMQRT